VELQKEMTVRSAFDELNHARQLTKSLGKALDALSDRLPVDALEPDKLAPKLKAIMRVRQERNSLFPEKLFSDPAWDILLYLLLAELEGRSVSISAACFASGIPPTTGLRWLRNLEMNGVIIRENDPADTRRGLLRLAEVTRSKLLMFISSNETNLVAAL
jgi:DNA-binding MarR family transcriptional regulator